MTDRDDDGQPPSTGHVGAEVDALKEQAQVATDSELAGLLGIDKSAVAQWRRRGKVPDKARLKVKYLVFAKEDETAAARIVADMSADVALYSKALAIIAIADGVREGLSDPELETQADRLRGEAMEFERACASAGRLLRGAMETFSETAWDSYRRCLRYGWLRHDVRERLQADLAAIRSALPQSPKEKR